VETNRAIRKVHTQAAGSDWQVCVTAWTPGGFLPLSDVFVNVKNIYMRSKGAWHLAGTYENNMKITSEGLTAIYTKICTYQNFLL